MDITSEDLCKYFCKKIYRVEELTSGAKPVHGRSASVYFWKKAISYFMPMKLEPWNPRTKEGNPTRSTVVNQMIKKVKKYEVQKQGAPSKARRALTAGKFESSIAILRKSEDPVKRYVAPAFHIYQFNMITRLDDTSHVKHENIKSHPDYDFALLGQMCWSKNVNEERDAPDQIMFGANDPKYCVLLALAVHLEVWFGTAQGSTPANKF